MSQTLRPGIYPDVDFDDYLSWNAISNSSLHAAKRSMLHYRCQRPIEETPSMKLGTLCHNGVFEPLTISERFVVMPRFEDQVRRPNGERYDSPKSCGAYRELVEEFEAENSDRSIVSQDQFDSMLGMVKALSAHQRASEFLSVRNETQVEVAIVWFDRETGLLCKGRVDALQNDIAMVSDLKTSADVANFEKVIFKFGYYRQMAFYCDGLLELTGESFSSSISAVENSRPFGVRAAPLSLDAMQYGRDEYRRLLRQIAASRSTNEWPGYQSPDEWYLPAWMTREPDTMRVENGELVSF